MALEICVDSVESAIGADRGGAERVELCGSLREGGITPSIGLISAARDAISAGLFVLIRPRGGDFVYSEREFDVMRQDIQEAKVRGVDGVVLGLLKADGCVDTERTRCLIEVARPLQVTYHRAFDVSADLDRSLEDVIACGADRLLTSGGEATAMRGMERIARLQVAAAGRIRLMAGAGLRRSNVRSFVRQTGVREIHSSLRTRTSFAIRGAVIPSGMGTDDEEWSRFLVREEEVRRFQSELNGIAEDTEQGMDEDTETAQ